MNSQQQGYTAAQQLPSSIPRQVKLPLSRVCTEPHQQTPQLPPTGHCRRERDSGSACHRRAVQKESLVKALESPVESVGNNKNAEYKCKCRLMGPLGIRAVFERNLRRWCKTPSMWPKSWQGTLEGEGNGNEIFSNLISLKFPLYGEGSLYNYRQS